ncbi:hypothetical protein [Mesorhizobium sp. M0019]|uniref:hypothetical protein n=1 Tax=Mesorhizobium sp. M0019 TaxID=2956845 RepID=UPI00333C6A65
MKPYEQGFKAGTDAVQSKSEATIRLDADPYNDQQRRALVDGIIDAVAEAGRTIKGIRVETSTFLALDIKKDRANSGVYRGAIVVEAMLDGFGSPIEVVVNAV